MILHYFLLGAFLVLNIACSTRQVVDGLAGATEQRLITHSIDKLMNNLPAEDFSQLSTKKVYLVSHFINKKELANLTDYAVSLLKSELEEKYQCLMVEDVTRADFELIVFFTSLGTDRDVAGFTLPPLLLPGTAGAITIDILALDMYHGVTELYHYIKDRTNQVMVKGEKIKAVVRTDKLALPIIYTYNDIR